jgi:hypothetical protein
MDPDQRPHQPKRIQNPLEDPMYAATRALIVGLLLCAPAFLLAERGAAQAANTAVDSGCGQSRLVLVRFEDGRPVPGVKVTLSAASPAMGGPEIYRSQSPDGDPDAGIVPPPVNPTPQSECTPVITGTLASVTDQSGLARFERLGEGTWMLRFSGEVSSAGRTAPIVPAPIQGLFPYGRTREGGGFVESVDALNEHGGPNPEPVQPGVGPTTSRYLLHYSAEHGGWLPGLDLAAADDLLPAPLAQVTSVTTPELDVVDGRSRSTADAGAGADTETDRAGESSFDPSRVEVMPPEDEAPTQVVNQAEGASRLTVSWAILLLLALGALLVVLRMRRWRRDVA